MWGYSSLGDNGVEIAERFAFYGVSSNLITYLTDTLHQSTASAGRCIHCRFLARPVPYHSRRLLSKSLHIHDRYRIWDT